MFKSVAIHFTHQRTQQYPVRESSTDQGPGQFFVPLLRARSHTQSPAPSQQCHLLFGQRVAGIGGSFEHGMARPTRCRRVVQLRFVQLRSVRLRFVRLRVFQLRRPQPLVLLLFDHVIASPGSFRHSSLFPALFGRGSQFLFPLVDATLYRTGTTSHDIRCTLSSSLHAVRTAGTASMATHFRRSIDHVVVVVGATVVAAAVATVATVATVGSSSSVG